MSSLSRQYEVLRAETLTSVPVRACWDLQRIVGWVAAFSHRAPTQPQPYGNALVNEHDHG